MPRSEAALRESERYTSEIISQLGVGFGMANPQGLMISWNRAIEEITGASAESVLDTPYWEVIPRLAPELSRSAEWMEHMKRSVKTALATGDVSGIKTPFEANINLENGRRRVIMHSTFVVRMEDGNYLGSIIQDITDRKKAEEALRIESERSKTLARLATRLNASLGLQEVMSTICEEAANLMKSPIAIIRTFDEGNHSLSVRAVYGLPADAVGKLLPVPSAIIDAIFKEGENIVVYPDLADFPDTAGAAVYRELGFSRAIICRLNLKGLFAGLLSIVNKDLSLQLPEIDMTLMEMLTNQAAVAINNALLYETVIAGRERLRAVSARLIEVQEAERRALALELHDELGQILSGIKLSLDMYPRLPPETAAEQIVTARNASAEAIDIVRKLALELRPAMLDQMGLAPTLKWLFRNFQEQTKARLDYHFWGLERRFSPKVEITVYRIIQEALTNIIKHAKNQQTLVDIWADERMLNLQVSDQGGGFDTGLILSQGISTGLSGMRERARLMGGELVIESKVGAGTTISASLPLDPEQS